MEIKRLNQFNWHLLLTENKIKIYKKIKFQLICLKWAKKDKNYIKTYKLLLILWIKGIKRLIREIEIVSQLYKNYIICYKDYNNYQIL